MILKGLREVTSSELQLLGGTGSSKFNQAVEKIRNFFDFIADYIPSLVQGVIDGLSGKGILK